MLTIIDQLLSCLLFQNSISDFYVDTERGTQHNMHLLLGLLEKWEKMIDNQGCSGAVLMDISKAFDTINHELLLAKLYAYGFEKQTLRLLKSYLTERWQRTKINRSVSSWTELDHGVPQESVSGPLLFNIYINELFLIVDQTYLQLC